MANTDVTKAELYHTLYELNAAFTQATIHCQTLQQTFTSKASKLFPDFVRELQAEINSEFLNPLHDRELSEWGKYGKVRQKWEKWLERARTTKEEITDEPAERRVYNLAKNKRYQNSYNSANKNFISFISLYFSICCT
jgi:hypothetical protein